MTATNKPKAETFVPHEVLELLNTLENQYAWTDVAQFNKWFYQNRPNIPRSSVKRWTRAYLNREAHSQTPVWHVRYREEMSLIPQRFSDLNGKFLDARKQWDNEGVIQYANVSCLHRPDGDPALIDLMLETVRDFKPNCFPYFSDTVSMELFKPHTPLVQTAQMRDESPEPNKYKDFVNRIAETDEMFSSAIPKTCVKLNLWGNHENWILKSLLRNAMTTGDTDLVDFTLDPIFTEMQKRNILWVEADARQFVPLSRLFWVGHGDKARSGEMGTAKGYASQVKNSVSIAVGHTHRQEVLWVKTPVGDRFVCVAGTLGKLNNNYAKNAFLGHNWGYQFITYPRGDKGAYVEDIRINYRDGYYITHFRGREYSQPATFRYNELDYV